MEMWDVREFRWGMQSHWTVVEPQNWDRAWARCLEHAGSWYVSRYPGSFRVVFLNGALMMCRQTLLRPEHQKPGGVVLAVEIWCSASPNRSSCETWLSTERDLL